MGLDIQAVSDVTCRLLRPNDTDMQDGRFAKDTPPGFPLHYSTEIAGSPTRRLATLDEANGNCKVAHSAVHFIRRIKPRGRVRLHSE